ncbi:MAG TPA: MGMT family protein [Steroidobacteraceae bacterium]|nr:MGMT family protein [Steroidobacteraceae bacterium]
MIRQTDTMRGELAMARRKKPVEQLLRPLAAAPSGLGPARGESAALEAIWQVVCAIPRGQASTYGAVARAAGLPGRARLTGFALRVAPEELNLPWHRVVGAGGRIVFPSGSRQHREQARRLRAEGVAVTAGRIPRTALRDLQEL